MPVCNTTLEDAYISEEPLFGDWTWHRLGLTISAGFGGFSSLISLLLILAHATHYSKPWEQRHIIRILLMIPIYSAVSFLSYKYYRHAIYFQVLRDCYEAFAIASFFTLLCHYIAPNLREQKEYFRQVQAKNWFWKVFGLQLLTGGKHRGPLRIPKSGLTWFNVIWIGVFQYCMVRVLCTIASVVTQYFDVYCEESKSPGFAHIWITAVEALSVTVAMFFLIQFYIQLREELAPHKPFLKVLCIKLVIFFSFWQTFVIDLLSGSKGPLQPTKTLAHADIQIGIPSSMLCIEMAIFSVMHIFAFPWQIYRIDPSGNYMGAESGVPLSPLYDTDEGLAVHKQGQPRYHGGFLGIYALLETFNPWDIVKATARGLRWLFVGSRNRKADRSYHTDPKTAVARNGITNVSPPMPIYGNAVQVDGPSIPPSGHMTHRDDQGMLSGMSQYDDGSDIGLRASHEERGLLQSQQYPAYNDPRWQTMPSAEQYRHYETVQDLSYRSSTADQFPSPPYNPGTAVSPGIGIAVTGDEPPNWLSKPPTAAMPVRPAQPQINLDPERQARREQLRREQFEAQTAASSRPTSRARSRSRSRSRPRTAGSSRVRPGANARVISGEQNSHR